VVIDGRLKTKENFKLLTLKVVVTVSYQRWLLTRGSKYSDLTWKLLVYWEIIGNWGEVVAYKRLLQPQAWLYLMPDYNCFSVNKKLLACSFLTTKLFLLILDNLNFHYYRYRYNYFLFVKKPTKLIQSN